MSETTDTTTTSAAATTPDETAADSVDTPEAGGTEAAYHNAAQDGDSQPDGDTFPRDYVEKLRKQNASYRDRAKAAEATVTALQRQHVDEKITAAGLKPAAVWAVAELADVLDDRGAVHAGKLNAVMQSARETLGIKRSFAKPGNRDLRSGAGVPQEPRNDWTAAFGPHRRD